MSTGLWLLSYKLRDMAINSRNKGNKAERDLAKQLKEWAGKEFARSPSSGGLQWGSTFAKGDIVCTTEGHYFPFCVEIKFHKEIDTNNLLVGKKESKIVSFWEQCRRDAKLADKIPILFMRYNMLPKGEWLVGISLAAFKALPWAETTHNRMLIKNSNLELGGMVLMNSKIFFESDYKAIKLIRKTDKKAWQRAKK